VAEYEQDTQDFGASGYGPEDYPTKQGSRAVRRAPDVFTLIIGLGVLFASAYVITDGNAWLPSVDPRWLLAGGALFVGLLLLGASVRPRRR
jgi:hypothetical protein